MCGPETRAPDTFERVFDRRANRNSVKADRQRHTQGFLMPSHDPQAIPAVKWASDAHPGTGRGSKGYWPNVRTALLLNRPEATDRGVELAALN